MIKPELTTQEAQALLQLIDLACKAGGVNVAEACLVLSKKIVDASKVANELPASDAKQDA